MKNAKPESNCEVLQTDNHDHVKQIAPIDADKAVKEYSEWEQGRKGRGTDGRIATGGSQATADYFPQAISLRLQHGAV